MCNFGQVYAALRKRELATPLQAVGAVKMSWNQSCEQTHFKQIWVGVDCGWIPSGPEICMEMSDTASPYLVFPLLPWRACFPVKDPAVKNAMLYSSGAILCIMFCWDFFFLISAWVTFYLFFWMKHILILALFWHEWNFFSSLQTYLVQCSSPSGTCWATVVTDLLNGEPARILFIFIFWGMSCLATGIWGNFEQRLFL